METYVYWQITTSIENRADGKTGAPPQVLRTEPTERQAHHYKYQKQSQMTGAPPRVLRKKPNDSSTTTSIEAQPPALLLSALNVKTIYQKLIIKDSSTEKLVETQSNQNKWIKAKLSRLDETRMTAIVTRPAHVLNLSVFCQQWIRSFRAITITIERI